MLKNISDVLTRERIRIVLLFALSKNPVADMNPDVLADNLIAICEPIV
jgi:hypothetical protein